MSKHICSTHANALRRGKWTPEEEEFAKYTISVFQSGYLSEELAGTTLRSYLSEKLNCDPMRLTKKFQGKLAIGKKIFTPCPDRDNPVVVREIEDAQKELGRLEKQWLKRMSTQKEEQNIENSDVYTDLVDPRVIQAAAWVEKANQQLERKGQDSAETEMEKLKSLIQSGTIAMQITQDLNREEEVFPPEESLKRKRPM
mmetsp:Transcript_22177/g.52395  ORF Transcript_22177/g.52395 Transcript_22177/m.52395 type:complete len:199 (+) Transcript_22177:190-786(+)